MAAITSLTMIAIAIYLLTVITNDFFIESLDIISAKLKLSPSVSGATLMAAGSSAPELSIALIALFSHGGAHSDLGIGTIVGSAVFNILVITGLCAVIKTAKVTLGAIIRDTAFYLTSILMLVYVFADGVVTPVEPVLLIAVYVTYMGALFLFPGDEFQEIPLHSTGTPKDDNNKNGLFKTINNAIISVTTLAAGNAKKNYLRAFTVSIIFIVVISKLLVDNAIIFAEAINLPPVIVALTILACGTSAPDLISSIIVVKQGRGDMAIANAVGSNIFDILIGLGLPWLIILYATSRDIIEVGTQDLMESVFILIGTVLVLFFFLCTKRQLGKREGIILLAIYAGYIGWTVAT